MKKMFSIALASCLLLTGCASAAAAGQKTSEIEISAIGNDYTVTPKENYAPSESAVTIASMNEHAIDFAVSPDAKGLIPSADLIIDGKILNIYYTENGAAPWIQMDVRIDNCLYGELESGDLVSVYSKGGYMPLKQYCDYGIVDFGDKDAETLLDLPFGTELPESGESYRFCLEKGYDDMPQGCYQTILGHAYSLYTEKDGIYTNKIGEDTISAEDMDALIAEK